MKLLVASNFYLSSSKPAYRTDLDYFSNALDGFSAFLDEARQLNAVPVLVGALIGKLHAAEAVRLTAKLLRAAVSPVVVNGSPCSVLIALQDAGLIRLVDKSPLQVEDWLLGHASMVMVAENTTEALFREKPKTLCFVNEPNTNMDVDAILYSPHIALQAQLQCSQLNNKLMVTLPHATRFHADNINDPCYVLIDKIGGNVTSKKVTASYSHDEYIKQIDPARKPFIRDQSENVSEFASKLKQLLPGKENIDSIAVNDNSFNSLIIEIGKELAVSDQTITDVIGLFA